MPTVTFFGTNDDPFQADRSRQKPLFIFEGHLTRGLTRRAILEAAREAAVQHRKMNRDIEGENLAKMNQAGLAVVEKVDPKPFQDALGDKIKKTYVDRFGSDLVDAIDKAKP